MLYMGISLAATASGLLLAYLLWQLQPAPGKTMNAVLVERITQGLPFGSVFVVATLFSEAMLLVVAAQAGFLDGPRVLSNMAVDSWVPHRFAALSERLTTQNGILLMGGAALLALFYTGGEVQHLVVMYAINVFVTFSLSMSAMLRYWQQHRRRPRAFSNLVLFAFTLLLCLGILVVTLYEKFLQGGWVTVAVTCLVIVLCLSIQRHYRRAAERVDQLYRELGDLAVPGRGESVQSPDPRLPIAAVLVESFGGVGVHTVLNVFRTFPNHFKGVVFLSVGVIDSGEFKGEPAVEHLRVRTEAMLARYVRLAAELKLPATAKMKIGTEVVSTAEALCLEAAREFPRATFFAGKLIFQRPRWWHRLLHNETAAAIQERLQWAGKTMVTLPIRVRDAGLGAPSALASIGNTPP